MFDLSEGMKEEGRNEETKIKDKTVTGLETTTSIKHQYMLLVLLKQITLKGGHIKPQTTSPNTSPYNHNLNNHLVLGHLILKKMSR